MKQKIQKKILPNEKNTGQRYDIVYFVILLRKYGIHIFASKYTGTKIMLTINKKRKHIKLSNEISIKCQVGKIQKCYI